MSEDNLSKISRSVLAIFLLSLGLLPGKDENSFEVRKYAPHMVFSLQARMPNGAKAIDPNNILALLVDYLERRKAFYSGPIFEPYDVAVYKCPLGSGTYIYVSISHTA